MPNLNIFKIKHGGLFGVYYYGNKSTLLLSLCGALIISSVPTEFHQSPIIHKTWPRQTVDNGTDSSNHSSNLR
jgi:hypothetical protein